MVRDFTYVQCKMAREGVGLNQNQLAKRAELHLTTIQRFENNKEVSPSTVEAIYTALLKAGAQFGKKRGLVYVMVPESSKAASLSQQRHNEARIAV